jgi:hypothetical protein
MTNEVPNEQLSLLLPKLKLDADVKAGDRQGDWDVQNSTAFANVASSLDYESPGQAKTVSSVPTMWARPLSMEMALHNPAHPLHQEMLEQWQGMLAAIALGEVRGFPLKAQLLEINESSCEDFAYALYQLLPDPVNKLYSLENKHPWQDIYVFLWNDKAVGMSTPSTLVCPAQEADWTGLSWWKPRGDIKVLQAPHENLNQNEKELLWRWLENLRQNLNNYQGDRHAVNRIGVLIDDFRSSLEVNPQQPLNLSDELQFFGVPLNRGVLNLLNKPVKAIPKPSSVRIIPSPEKEGKAKPLLLLDREIANAWNQSPQNIWINEGKTLASLKTEDLKSGKIIWTNVKWIESHELFLPELIFINQEEALPGGMSVQTTEPLAFNGEIITPLIPLNPILLNYFTPEDLIGKIRFQPINNAEGAQIRVILDLPLAGMNDGQPPENYRLVKDYLLKPENALEGLPVLEVWPNFRTPGWHEYYAFYYDAEWGDKTFNVSLPQTQELSEFEEGRGSYQLARLSEFPTYIECLNSSHIIQGLIFLPTPVPLTPRGKWHIGVDFGTSFTNIFVNQNNVIEPLNLKSLHLTITDAQIETRLPVLFENFIPEDFIPVEKPLPLSSILTTKGSSKDNEQMRPIFDGRIYIPDRSRFKPQDDWMKTDLKWSIANLDYNEVFIKHLALHITALAASEEIKEIKWSFSYPSAYSPGDCNRYAGVWQDVTKALQMTTEITHSCPESDDLKCFRTESLAIAQYFCDQEDHNLVNTTCIDMGGGTSDISIWEDNSLVHQCSVQLAGRDLFSQFLEMNPQFIQEQFGESIGDWKGLKGGAFNAKLDVLLRLEGENWLQNKRDRLIENENFQGLLRLTAIGTAGLYYYVGMILRALHEDGIYSDEITPVYIGGNGSRFLNWLAERGRFDRNSQINLLLSRMLSKGSGFEDTKEFTRLSLNPKDEVACGLVIEDTKLKGLDKNTDNSPIAGEKCLVNDQEIAWQDRLSFTEDVTDFKVDTLTELPRFLYEFNLAIKQLKIEGLKPLKNYELSPNPEDNNELWRNTTKELKSSLLKIKGNSENIRVEPPFILALKTLLKILGKEWAGKS